MKKQDMGKSFIWVSCHSGISHRGKETEEQGADSVRQTHPVQPSIITHLANKNTTNKTFITCVNSQFSRFLMQMRSCRSFLHWVTWQLHGIKCDLCILNTLQTHISPAYLCSSVQSGFTKRPPPEDPDRNVVQLLLFAIIGARRGSLTDHRPAAQLRIQRVEVSLVFPEWHVCWLVSQWWK